MKRWSEEGDITMTLTRGEKESKRDVPPGKVPSGSSRCLGSGGLIRCSSESRTAAFTKPMLDER